MRVTTGTGVNGKIEIPGESFAEGTSVTILAREDGERFTLGPEAEAELLISIEEADRGEFISGDELLRESAASQPVARRGSPGKSLLQFFGTIDAEDCRLMEQAISRDPHYGPALAWAAFCCHRLLLDDGSKDREADRLKGIDFARRALQTAGDDPAVLANAAQALASFGEDIGATMALADRALALNPNYARGWHVSGTLRLYAGQPDIAIEHLEAALRLSPRARVGPLLLNIGAAHFLSRRFDQAVPKLLVAIQEDPSHPQPYRWLAACYASMGRLDDAREIVVRLRAITSVVIPDALPLRNAEHRELYLSGLRLAAGEAV